MAASERHQQRGRDQTWNSAACIMLRFQYTTTAAYSKWRTRNCKADCVTIDLVRNLHSLLSSHGRVEYIIAWYNYRCKINNTHAQYFRFLQRQCVAYIELYENSIYS